MVVSCTPVFSGAGAGAGAGAGHSRVHGRFMHASGRNQDNPISNLKKYICFAK